LTEPPPKDPHEAASPPSKRKVTLYFNATMLAETQREAIRQDRSISWIIQAAWKRARDEIRRLPGVGTADAAGAAAQGEDKLEDS
jgi:uncharacterized small protein (TIGR04563 family)